MAAPLIIPQHIKEARLAALGAGIAAGPDDVATTVLYLAAVAYNRLPQVNKAEELRQEKARTQHELEDVSSQLVSERKHGQRLTNLVEQLREQLQQVQTELGGVRGLLSLAPREEPIQDRVPKGKTQQLRAEIGALRAELARRPPHTDETLRENWLRERGLRRGLRTYLRQVHAVLADPAATPDEKLLLAQPLLALALLVGMPNEKEAAQALRAESGIPEFTEPP